MTRTLSISPAGWLAGLLCLMLVTCGCQQLRKRDAQSVPMSPPPYEVAPEFGAPSQPTPLSAPMLPPAEDLEIPPLPGTAAAGSMGGPRLGGFTPPPTYDDLPELSMPDDDLNDSSAPRIRPTSNAELDITSRDEREFPSEEPVLLREFLKSRPQQVVELDADLFRLELEAENLESPVVPQLAAPAIATGLALQPVVIQPLAPKSPGRDAPEWPTGGVPHEIIVTPGPSVQKWVDEPVRRVQGAMPRRLAEDNSDWAVRAIE